MTKPRKAYKPRPAGARTLRTQPWKLNGVFGPLEEILNQMELSGNSDTDAFGTLIFRDAGDANWYASSAAINGVADAYEAHALRSGRPMPLEPLRMLAKKFRYGTMVFPAELDAARAAIAELRRESLGMTEDYAASLLQTVRIQIEIEKSAARE